MSALLLALLAQSEDAALEAVVRLFTGAPVVEKDKDGRTRAIKLEGRPGKSTATLSIQFEAGRVVALKGNGVGIANQEFALFKPFAALRTLSLHHNKGPGDEAIYDGSGLVHLKELAELREVQLPGSPFGDGGLRAAAELKALKSLGIWHVRVSNEGFAALAGHPSLEEIRVAPMWGPQIGDAALERLSECPKLASVRLNEAYVTYEGGLKHLLKRKATLKAIDLGQSLVAPEDLERLRSELPGATVTHAGLAAVGKLVAEDFKGARKKLSKIAPAELLERYLAAAR
jgi:hypothetical protein